MNAGPVDRPGELRYRRQGGIVLLAFAIVLLVVLAEDTLDSEVTILHATAFAFMVVACAIYWIPLLRKS